MSLVQRSASLASPKPRRRHVCQRNCTVGVCNFAAVVVPCWTFTFSSRCCSSLSLILISMTILFLRSSPFISCRALVWPTYQPLSAALMGPASSHLPGVVNEPHGIPATRLRAASRGAEAHVGAQSTDLPNRLDHSKQASRWIPRSSHQAVAAFML